ATTIEFRGHLKAQHTDAQRHGDIDRQAAYAKAIDTLNDTVA
ncbi:hypothetical protein SAMN05421505_1431, partial [Sinosporangium album]